MHFKVFGTGAEAGPIRQHLSAARDPPSTDPLFVSRRTQEL